MTMRAQRLIEVTQSGDGLPRIFRWRGRQITVRDVFDDWEEAGCWWLGEDPRRVYRVVASCGAAYELHHQASSGWRLHRVFD